MLGRPEAALLEVRGWITQHTPDFDPRSTSRFETTAACELRDLRAYPGRVVARMPVNPRSQNDYGSMHGGAFTALVDIVGFAALSSVKDNQGVSIQVSCDYYLPMPGGEDVEVDAQVVKVGKRVATVKVDFRRVRTADVVASGRLIAMFPDSAQTPSLTAKASDVAPQLSATADSASAASLLSKL